MQRYILHRLAQSIAVVFVVSAVVFSCLHVLPGDPFLARQGTNAALSAEDLQKLRDTAGLNKPLHEQYLAWIGGVARGDLGLSYFDQSSVSKMLALRLPATLELTLFSLLLSLSLALPLGIIAATHQNSIVDHVVTAVGSIGMSVPSFWLGMMLILVFSVTLRWLPAVGYAPLFDDPIGNLKHIAMPCVTLALVLVAPTMRFLRSSMLEVMRQEYVQTAKAKGLAPRSVVLVHVLKNAMIPTITVIGLQTGYLLGGSVVVEWVFGWPGLGQLVVDAISRRDYAVVQASVMTFATGFVLVNLLVDLLYGVMDPRIRYS